MRGQTNTAVSPALLKRRLLMQICHSNVRWQNAEVVPFALLMAQKHCVGWTGEDIVVTSILAMNSGMLPANAIPEIFTMPMFDDLDGCVSRQRQQTVLP